MHAINFCPMKVALRPRMKRWLQSMKSTWQVVSAGSEDTVWLPHPGPCSDLAVLVVFEGRGTSGSSVAVVPAGVEEVSRAGSMQIGAEAAARLDALANLRPGIVFGLVPTQFETGPVAALGSGEIEKHLRLEYFDGRRDPTKIFSVQGTVLRHRDWMLRHCGVVWTPAPARGPGEAPSKRSKTLDEAPQGGIIVPDLGSVLGICPGAVANIHRGGNLPSDLRISRDELGWRIPLSIIDAGLVARVARAFVPGIEKLHARYDENADLKTPFRRNPRRPTVLVATSLPRDVVNWMLWLPKDGLKHDQRLIFAGFANATGRREDVYATAKLARPDLADQLCEAQKWTRVEYTVDDLIQAPEKFERVGLRYTEEGTPSQKDVFTPTPRAKSGPETAFFGSNG